MGHRKSSLFRDPNNPRVGKGSWKRRGNDAAYAETMEQICSQHTPKPGRTTYKVVNGEVVEVSA